MNLIADGSDNFEKRYLINDACYFLKKTLVSAAILGFDAQIFTFKPKAPCYRCIFSNPPIDKLIPSCAEGGGLGSVAGVAGTIQATEVIKELLGIGRGLSNNLMIFSGVNQEFIKIRTKSDPKCKLCGKNPKIKKLLLTFVVALVTKSVIFPETKSIMVWLGLAPILSIWN